MLIADTSYQNYLKKRNNILYRKKKSLSLVLWAFFMFIYSYIRKIPYKEIRIVPNIIS